jgi:hypothetical protein
VPLHHPPAGAAASTARASSANGRLISRNGHRMQRFEAVLDLFNGELVALDDAGRPLFNELLFGRR